MSTERAQCKGFKFWCKCGSYQQQNRVMVLKEQIKEVIEKNSQLEQENNLLKILVSPEQLTQISSSLLPFKEFENPETRQSFYKTDNSHQSL
uniref:TSC22 domain family protein 1 n=1 Tax=Rattus norvegicus TaxID=10116 RepID=A0A8I6A360_RAT